MLLAVTECGDHRFSSQKKPTLKLDRTDEATTSVFWKSTRGIQQSEAHLCLEKLPDFGWEQWEAVVFGQGLLPTLPNLLYGVSAGAGWVARTEGLPGSDGRVGDAHVCGSDFSGTGRWRKASVCLSQPNVAAKCVPI